MALLSPSDAQLVPPSSGTLEQLPGINLGAPDIASSLVQDPVFVSAVKKQDVHAAAAAASQLMKQHTGGKSRYDVDGSIPLRRRTSDILQEGGPPNRIKPGDWVIIRSSNKSTDPELLGQEGVVNRLEQNAWVEMYIPKLGKTIKLQQRYLAHVPPPPGMMGRTGAAQGAEGDDGSRPSKRPHHEAYTPFPPAPPRGVSLTALGQTPLPARVPPLVGRGVTKMKEVVKAVRKEMLGLEQDIAWDCVEAEWKSKRPLWRKNLKALLEAASGGSAAAGGAAFATGGGGGGPSTAEVLVSQAAYAMLELHEALRTDKSQGVFAAGGLWESRLQELTEGGNNYAALQQLWEEMHEGVRMWLNGDMLQPYSTDPSPGPRSQGHAHHTSHHHHHHHSHHHSEGVRRHHGRAQHPHPSSAHAGGLDHAGCMAVYRAFTALEAAALKGQGYVQQVPLDKILGPSREGFAVLRSLVEKEKAHILGRMEALHKGELPPPPPPPPLSQLPPHLKSGAADAGTTPAAAGAAGAAGSTAPSEEAGAAAAGGAPAEAVGEQPQQEAAPVAAPAEAAAAAAGAAAVPAAAAAPQAQPESATAERPQRGSAAAAAAPAAAAGGLSTWGVALGVLHPQLDLLMSPGLREELQMVAGGVESEPGTEEDSGGEVTDMDDSDG